jgi:hypothetical protein
MTRDDLVEYLVHHSPRPAISRAIAEGRPIEFLGGFSLIPPSKMPGWIVKVTSRFGREFFIALRTHKLWKQELFVEIITKVPWKYWDGDKAKIPLYQGDIPEEYRRLKNESATRTTKG